MEHWATKGGDFKSRVGEDQTRFKKSTSVENKDHICFARHGNLNVLVTRHYDCGLEWAPNWQKESQKNHLFIMIALKSLLYDECKGWLNCYPSAKLADGHWTYVSVQDDKLNWKHVSFKRHPDQLIRGNTAATKSISVLIGTLSATVS